MDGIEKITQRIEADAQAEAARILTEAKQASERILADYSHQAEEAATAYLKKSEEEAVQKEERLCSMAKLNARKMLLSAKQGLVDKAYERALSLLTEGKGESYVVLVAKLAAAASRTGKENLILSPLDKEKFGDQIVEAANDLLRKGSLSKQVNGQDLAGIGKLLEKLFFTVSVSLSQANTLKLADETRKMAGGVILKEGDCELNGSFEVLLRLKRDVLAAEVAQCLFD